MYLENIKGPQDVQQLNLEQLQTLSQEVRNTLIQKVSAHGGHIGPI